jgi:hypothetical protein
MSKTINWLSDLEQAKAAARQANKPVLLDFFNPQ